MTQQKCCSRVAKQSPGGCPQPIKDSDLGGNYRISPTPGKGLGMFTTCDLNTGDLIVNERPLMVVPHIPVGVLTDEGVLDEQASKTILHQAEKVMCPIFEHMHEEDKKAFMELHNSHLQDGSGPILGVIRTDGCVFGNEAGIKENHTSIFKDLSRVNHSCSPNASHKFHISTFSMQLRTARDIKEGKEIFTTYTDILKPAAVHAKNLAPYQITCACACHACLDPNKSGPIRAAVLKHPAIFIPMQKVFGEDWIDPALETLSCIEQEELQGRPGREVRNVELMKKSPHWVMAKMTRGVPLLQSFI
ncbi:hypothetical protein EDD85DRAFT_951933 [Armillaria nabsnona]|nr:hypothetical protein EDD85DRAFT_951933 [Armillaria nabsnona]